MKEIPIWEKSNLTLEEAAAYSGIGINKLRELYEQQGLPFRFMGRNQTPDQASVI